MYFRHRITAALLAVLLMLPMHAARAQSADPITRAQLLGLLVSAYEFLDDSEIDDSAITSKLSTDKPVRKALEIDILDAQDAAGVLLPATRQDAARHILSLRNALRTDTYGTACAQATVAQARDELGLALRLIGRTDSIADVRAMTGYAPDGAPLTRALLCELLVMAYEQLYGPCTPSVYIPDDTDSPYVRKAIALGLMDAYHASNTFEPDEPVQLRQLAESILRLTARDPLSGEALTADEARNAVSELLLSHIGVSRPEGIRRTVLHDVEWDWYVNQLSTGAYSANNCMPACGEMLLNYFDRDNVVTTAMLRALSPHDGEGWYDVEFLDVLTDAGVRMESEYELTEERMLTDLDEGHLLVVMVNFDGAESGHAMVVCGYETTPAGTWLICQDPESPAINKYGEPCGYMRRIEVQETVAAMRRHVQRYFRVMN